MNNRSDFFPAQAGLVAPSPTDSNLRISVIIPHYNDMENLGRCLSLLAKQTLPPNNYEIIVADNNSKCGIDAVKALCRDQARVVPAPIQGAAEARNTAVRASQGAILAFIDSDCRPSPGWLEEGTKAVAFADIIGGKVDVDFADPGRPTGVEAFEKVFAFDFKRYIEKDNFSGTGNMFVLRSNFDKIGDFRSGVSEDREWGNRAVKMGFKLQYAKNVLVSHPARNNWNELTHKWERITKQTYLYNVNNNSTGIRWLYYCIIILASPFIHLNKIVNPDTFQADA